jgi:16S rRNA (cytosine1402-N4)-methyltransferase
LRVIVEKVFGYRAPSVLPRIFQALRIAVNEELEALETLLTEAPKLLLPGGRLGIISFHSLEDRMVKQYFKSLCTPEKDPLTGQTVRQAAFAPVTKKPAVPSEEEIRENPRARSAKFRVIERL